jgi:hypothetical protein
MIAVGVARPSAHGQAITSTEIAATPPPVGLPNASHQTRNATAAITSTVGTNTDATRSARRCRSALPAWARSTIVTIRARAVSDPTAVARTVSTPEELIVAPTTRSPTDFSTGTDSPVSIDSSTADPPSITSPSTGIVSPGRTRKTSSTTTSATGTSTSMPSRMTRADEAPSSARARRASPARRLARASMYRPSTRKVMISAAASK